VRDIGGMTLRKPRRAGFENRRWRSDVRLSGSRSSASGSSSQALQRPVKAMAAVQSSRMALLRRRDI